jgi:hypothetical protein
MFEIEARIINIPAEYISIQDGIDASANGDTVLIAPGIYYEQLVIGGKSITLTSNYIVSKDPAVIAQTIIDGSNTAYVLSILNSAGTETFIHGLTIQNGKDGIRPDTPFKISNCYITNCSDGIDYENGSGGICIDNTFIENSDDGIDLDDDVDIVIENNKILNNGDDGIEVRCQPYTGTTLNIKIINNIITGNEEDGIQLIDYPGLSDRIIYIENNLIVDNFMAGLGCMADGNTTEDYGGAAIPEPIYLINNTFSGNNHGITGGANLIAFNNIVVNCIATAMKNVNGSSFISYSNLWNNGQNFDNCIIDDQSLVFAIGTPLTDIEYTHRGNPPDIGAYENIADEDQSLPVELKSFNGNYLEGNIELNWITSGELNNLGYEIYVKEEQREFRYLAGYTNDNSLMGLGNSSQGKKYNYVHKNVGLGTNYFYKLIQYDFSGDNHEYGPIEISTTHDTNDNKSAQSITMLQNFPNPFNPKTIIRYELPITNDVELSVYNLLGQKVTTLVNERKQAGYHQVEWDAGQFSSGVYYYRIEAGEFQDMKKMILLR